MNDDAQDDESRDDDYRARRKFKERKNFFLYLSVNNEDAVSSTNEWNED
jgi:hypothetical protein